MHRIPNRTLDLAAAALAVLLAALPAAAAHAATLRPMTTLHAPVVLLSDLFDDAGPLAGRVLGPAPAPGERIVVPATQLAAIARMFGVAWQPASPADSAVLERPGRLLPRAAVLSALHEALAGAGAAADAEVDLPGFAAPLIPAEIVPTVQVEQLDYEAGADHFAADLLIAGTPTGAAQTGGAPMAPLRLRVFGSIEAMAEVVVPTARLQAGRVLRAEDIAPARMRAALLHGAVVRDPAQAVGMALRRTLAAGQPITPADLVRPGLIAKGAPVTLQIDAGGLVATARGIAMAAGAPGERIAVLNPTSRLVVEGEVLPSGVVAVAPGSAPLGGVDQVAVR